MEDGGERDPLEALREANERFYRALEALDLARMDGVWHHGPDVRCVHPGWDALVGWDAVRASFDQIFASTGWIRVTATDISVQVIGDVGLVTCSENITATQDDDVGVAVAQATNVFRRTREGWRMILHHASPAPVHVTQPFSGRVQ
jgi:ketosteroid isomerase-like protein